MINGAGVINLLWMLIGVWMGLFIASALPPRDAGQAQRVGGVQCEASPTTVTGRCL
jgi:hypothetical protein